MIVCHKYRFIFLKTTKTAGTSLEIALSRYCDENDVVTSLTADEEAMRSPDGRKRGRTIYTPIWRYQLWEWRRLLTRGVLAKVLAQHTIAGRAKERIAPEVWDGYYKFCVERNPWDKCVSMYYWLTRDSSQRPSFAEWLAAQPPKVLSNFWMYSIDGVVAVDGVLRYEHLTRDLDELAERLRLPGRVEMPRAKSYTRESKGHYSEMYGPVERDLVGRACAREIELLDYRFEEATKAVG